MLNELKTPTIHSNGTSADALAEPLFADDSQDYIELTPDYRRLFQTFLRDAKNRGTELAGSPKNTIRLVRPFVVSLDLALQTSTSVEELAKLREEFHALSMRIVERDNGDDRLKPLRRRKKTPELP